MFQLKEKGFSKLEFMMSVGFLMILVIFIYQVMEKQKNALSSANMRIDVTDMVYRMREILENAESCATSLGDRSPEGEGDDILELINVVEYPKTNEVEEFPEFTTRKGGGDKSRTGVTIESYKLKSSGIDGKEKVVDGVTWLIVEFKQLYQNGNVGNTLKKQIKIYYEKANGNITSCGLSPVVKSGEGWEEVKNSLVYRKGYVGIGTETPNTSLSVKGNLGLVNGEVRKCEQKLAGSIRFDSAKNVVEFCNGKDPWLDLIDKNSIWIN